GVSRVANNDKDLQTQKPNWAARGKNTTRALSDQGPCRVCCAAAFVRLVSWWSVGARTKGGTGGEREGRTARGVEQKKKKGTRCCLQKVALLALQTDRE